MSATGRTAQNDPSAYIPVRLTDGADFYEAEGGGGSGAVTPTAGLASVIAAGGTAVLVATGPISGGYITNPTNAAAQGIVTAENLYIDMVNTPGSDDAAANGTTTLLTPGQSFTLPELVGGVNVQVNAATTAHAFTVVLFT